MNGFSTKKTLANCRAPRKGIPVADPTPATITRNKLHAANDQPAHGCAEDHNYAFRHGRAASRIMGYVECDDFTLPRRPFMPSFTVSSLGTPGEARRDREARLEATWAKTFAICAALTAALIALWWVNAPQANQPRPADVSLGYRLKAAGLMPGQSLHFLNDQGCLVYLHKEFVGPIAVSPVSDHC